MHTLIYIVNKNTSEQYRDSIHLITVICTSYICSTREVLIKNIVKKPHYITIYV